MILPNALAAWICLAPAFGAQAPGEPAAVTLGPEYQDLMAQRYTDYVPRVKRVKVNNVLVVKSRVARRDSAEMPRVLGVVRQESEKAAMQRFLEEHYPKASSSVKTEDEHLNEVRELKAKLDLKQLKRRLDHDLKSRFGVVYLYEPAELSAYTARPR